METIDLTPTPLEYARIAHRMIEGAYGLDADQGLTNYQVLWTWQAAENAAEFIGAPLHELRRGLAEELLRHYLARAAGRPAIASPRPRPWSCCRTRRMPARSMWSRSTGRW